MPKPMSIMPMPFVFWLLTNLRNIMPQSTASGASVEGLNISMNAAPLEFISIRRIICAVTVVPMFAPMTMLMDWRRLSIPALKRPTVSTIVAVELYDAGYEGAREHTQHRAVGDLFQHAFKGFAGAAFEAVPHNVHSI